MTEQETGRRVVPSSNGAGPARIEVTEHGPYRVTGDYDDRTVCCHYGQCTSRLPDVFRADAEPFVDPDGATAPEIMRAVGGCPSGALSYARGDDAEPVEPEEPASITATVDGPYRVRGSIPPVVACCTTAET